jgi:hypothetical protein
MTLLTLMVLALDTATLQQGIDAAAAKKVVYSIPAGVHVVGTLRLPSNAHIRLEEGAVLRFSSQDADFAPREILDYEPFADSETSLFQQSLLFAEKAENITIEGPGKIDGNRRQRGGPKPIAMRRCRNIRIEGITIERAPNYAISLIGCDRVQILGVKIRGAHSDGIDLDCVRGAVIRDCDIESYDDAICLKTSAALGGRYNTEDVLVERCKLRTASVFFKLGTETYGDFKKIRVRDVEMIGGLWEGSLGNRHGNPGLALETVDGGMIRDVVMERVKMTDVGTPIFLRLGERRKAPGQPGAGRMKGIRIADIVATGARYPSVLAGLSEAPIEDVSIDGLSVNWIAGTLPNAKAGVSERRAAYPEPIMFGSLPAAVLYVRHLVGLKLSRLGFVNPGKQAALVLEGVAGKWPGCDAVVTDRLVCLDNRPSQRPDTGFGPQEKR